MRTVEEVMKELEEFKRHQKTVSDILEKIRSDSEVRTFFRDTFGMNENPLVTLNSFLSVKEMELRRKLDKCKVDV